MTEPSNEFNNAYFSAIGMIVTLASNTGLVLFNTFRVITGLPAGVAASAYYILDSLTPKKKMIAEIAQQTCTREQIALVKAITSATDSANLRRPFPSSLKVIRTSPRRRVLSPRSDH